MRPIGRTFRAPVLALTASGLCLVAILRIAGAAENHLLRLDDAYLVQLGALVYEENCASCHGTKLQGQPNWQEANQQGRFPAPPHDASGHTWHHSDYLLFEITKYGMAGAMETTAPSDMPAFKYKLSDGEIVAVLSYIKSRWPEEIQRVQEAANQKSD